MSCSSKFIKPKEGLWEPVIYIQSVRSTGDNLSFYLASEVGAVLWELALNLWDLRLSPGTECQN